MDLERILLKETLKKIDLTEYTPQVEEAVKSYFSSDEFIDSMLEAMNDEGIGWEMGKQIAKKFSKEIDKIKIEISL